MAQNDGNTPEISIQDVCVSHSLCPRIFVPFTLSVTKKGGHMLFKFVGEIDDGDFEYIEMEDEPESSVKVPIEDFTEDSLTWFRRHQCLSFRQEIQIVAEHQTVDIRVPPFSDREDMIDQLEDCFVLFGLTDVDDDFAETSEWCVPNSEIHGMREMVIRLCDGLYAGESAKGTYETRYFDFKIMVSFKERPRPESYPSTDDKWGRLIGLPYSEVSKAIDQDDSVGVCIRVCKQKPPDEGYVRQHCWVYAHVIVCVDQNSIVKDEVVQLNIPCDCFLRRQDEGPETVQLP